MKEAFGTAKLDVFDKFVQIYTHLLSKVRRLKDWV